jgi:phage replication O-like protein O
MSHDTDGFIRFPRFLLEALLNLPLNGSEWRILLWVIRHTYGWHVKAARFSWYQIAKDLAMDRGGIVRTGNRLAAINLLRLQGRQVGIEADPSKWRLLTQEKALMPISSDACQRNAMTEINASDENGPRNRWQESSLFQRAKERSKEKEKNYKETRARGNDTWHRIQNGNDAVTEHHPAGAARPIPGKYDGLSQN